MALTDTFLCTNEDCLIVYECPGFANQICKSNPFALHLLESWNIRLSSPNSKGESCRSCLSAGCPCSASGSSSYFGFSPAIFPKRHGLRWFPWQEKSWGLKLCLSTCHPWVLEKDFKLSKLQNSTMRTPPFSMWYWQMFQQSQCLAAAATLCACKLFRAGTICCCMLLQCSALAWYL